jgi:hypothetical protein
MPKSNDVTESPVNPQFQLGATSDEAAMEQQLIRSPLEGPGGIVSRLENQQWSIARAQPDANMSRDHGTPYG